MPGSAISKVPVWLVVSSPACGWRLTISSSAHRRRLLKAFWFTAVWSPVFPRHRDFAHSPWDRERAVGPRQALPFGVVYRCPSQNDPHSRSGAVQVINCQRLFIGGSSNNKHDDILRPVMMKIEREYHRLRHKKGTKICYYIHSFNF